MPLVNSATFYLKNICDRFNEPGINAYQKGVVLKLLVDDHGALRGLEASPGQVSASSSLGSQPLVQCCPPADICHTPAVCKARCRRPAVSKALTTLVLQCSASSVETTGSQKDVTCGTSAGPGVRVV